MALALVLIFQLISGAFTALVPYKVHRTAGLLLGAIVILHIILNRPWIRANYLRR